MVQEDIIKAIEDFHKHGKLVKWLNAPFIALILKNRNRCLIIDYRLISLIGNVNKLIAKVLKARLKRVMSVLLS